MHTILKILFKWYHRTFNNVGLQAAKISHAYEKDVQAKPFFFLRCFHVYSAVLAKTPVALSPLCPLSIYILIVLPT